ncbi:MAG: hypothetical protein AB8H03_16530 [Saprospiraceae bacterium]
MKTLFLLFSFSFLFFLQNGFSQIDKNVLVESKGKFYYQNNVYFKSELGQVFKLDDTAFNFYKKHRKARRVFIASGITAVVLGGGGLILFNIDGPPNQGEGDRCYELCPHQGVGIYMILASWPPALASLISLPISRKNYKRAMKSFKLYTESAPKYGVNQMELDFNYTGNGIGLVLNF